MWALLGFLTWHGLPGATTATGATAAADARPDQSGPRPAPVATSRCPGPATTAHRGGRRPGWRALVTSRTLGVSAALVDGELLPGDVRVDGDTVVEVGLPPAAGGRIAAPGLVDLQVNGFAGDRPDGRRGSTTCTSWQRPCPDTASPPGCPP